MYASYSINLYELNIYIILYNIYDYKIFIFNKNQIMSELAHIIT